MRKHAFEILVSVLVTIGVALVLATGYLSYTSISSIVESIHEDNRPDEKLNLISDIATGIEKAESSIRLYPYTKQKSDLRPYRDLITGIDDQLDSLRRSAEGEERFLKNIDTVAGLIERKIEVWNDMLALSDANVASQYLDTISRQLESKIESDSLRKNRSIFKKLFKKQKKQEIDEEKIVRDIEDIREQEKLRAQRVKQKEIQLAVTSTQLTERFYSLINKLKADEQAERISKAEKANILAMETYRWIGWFALSATLASILVIFVISTYMRKIRASRKALEASKAEAENLAKTKELFVANVSHEIRTPMNVISGFVDQLLRKPLEESLAATLKIVKSSSDHLVRIINDILDFSKLQSGKMKLEPVHYRIRNVMNEIRLLFQGQAAENKSELVIADSGQLPDVLYGDPVRLKQILINLVSNAIKFTKDGRVEVHISATNFSGNNMQLTLEVKDTGIGIDNANLEKIFEDFTQAGGDTSRKYGGTGLGLSIVNKLVDLHNGTINVESRINKGTRFTIQLPYRNGEPDKVEENMPQKIDLPENIRKMKVLVVDDEVYNRKLMSTILEKWKLNFEEAKDGNEAIEKVNNDTYDFILLDVQMPGPDGFEVTDYIRKSLELSTDQTAIILTTATSVSREEYEKYKARGIDAYLPKPFTEELLLKAMTNVLDGKGESEFDRKPVTSKKTDDGTSPLNLEELRRFAGNDQAFVKEMLEKYMESFEDGMSKMKQAISDNNLQMVSDMAHKLASPSRHIGAISLLENIKKVESLADNGGNPEKIRQVIEQSEVDYKAVKNAIRKHLEKTEN